MADYLSPKELAHLLRTIVKEKDEATANRCLRSMYDNCPVVDIDPPPNCLEVKCPFESKDRCFLNEINPTGATPLLACVPRLDSEHFIVAPNKFGAFYLLCVQKMIAWNLAPRSVKDKLQRMSIKNMEKTTRDQ